MFVDLGVGFLVVLIMSTLMYDFRKVLNPISRLPGSRVWDTDVCSDDGGMCTNVFPHFSNYNYVLVRAQACAHLVLYLLWVIIPKFTGSDTSLDDGVFFRKRNREQ